ncbi:GntR family transcriptional regulator [soil metagenome]
MNSGATSERVYDALKRRIMTNAFRPGDRLDPSVLAETLASSVTPIRDALHLLTGEGLVETRTSDGFHLPRVDAPALQDLYGWNAEVLGLALRKPASKPTAGGASTVSPDNTGDAADRAATIFTTVAHRSGNIEHRRAIASVNDRLHAARRVEHLVLDGVDHELTRLKAALAAGIVGEMLREIGRYHRRRHRSAAEIARTLYRDEA